MGLPSALTVTEAAHECGLNISTIYRWIASGFLPAHPRPFGKGFLVWASDVERCKDIPVKGEGRGCRTPKRPWSIRARDKRRQAVRQYQSRQHPPGVE